MPASRMTRRLCQIIWKDFECSTNVTEQRKRNIANWYENMALEPNTLGQELVYNITLFHENNCCVSWAMVKNNHFP